ncbi:hypothetical protein diail_10989 [Diaporthe ilicicola]|nr:hypothetical protein diail_10989 [Diaporthe ilicicola]
MAIIAALATTAPTDAMASSLTYTQRANATEVLAANDIWSPNLTEFAAGRYNTDGVNFTAEGEKLVQSGLSVDDLVHIGAGETRETSLAVATEKQSCGRCDLCFKACTATILMWPL